MKRWSLPIGLITLALVMSGGLGAQQTKKPRTKSANPKTTQSAQQPAATDTSSSKAEGEVKEDFKRLILKDGSYQGVIKYQVIGDRVHYFSSERYTWEDIPNELIDWDASRKFAAAEAAGNTPSRAREVDADAERERAEEEAKSPTVSPGIRLPESGGVFLLDVYQGKPELNELLQNGADVKKNTAGNILRGAINPIASAKQTIELKGQHARVQAHVGDPFIYVNIDQDQDPTNTQSRSARP